MADGRSSAGDDAIGGRLHAEGRSGGATDGGAGESSSWLHCGWIGWVGVIERIVGGGSCGVAGACSVPGLDASWRSMDPRASPRILLWDMSNASVRLTTNYPHHDQRRPRLQQCRPAATDQVLHTAGTLHVT